MSNRLGISPNHYSNIENGKRQADLSLSMTVRIADIFGISIEEIVEYESKKSDEVGCSGAILRVGQKQ